MPTVAIGKNTQSHRWDWVVSCSEGRELDQGDIVAACPRPLRWLPGPLRAALCRGGHKPAPVEIAALLIPRGWSPINTAVTQVENRFGCPTCIGYVVVDPATNRADCVGDPDGPPCGWHGHTSDMLTVDNQSIPMSDLDKEKR